MSFEKKMAKWTDKQCLENFLLMLERVEINTFFLENDDGVIVSETLVCQCGEEVVQSEPVVLSTPVIPYLRAGSTIN